MKSALRKQEDPNQGAERGRDMNVAGACTTWGWGGAGRRPPAWVARAPRPAGRRCPAALGRVQRGEVSGGCRLAAVGAGAVGGGGAIERLGVEDPRMSMAVVHNGVVYLAGQVDAEGRDVAEQTANTLAKVDALLAQAGSDKSHILTAMIWLRTMDDAPAMNAVWNAWVDPDAKPARACVSADMARPVLLVEIQVTAALKAS